MKTVTNAYKENIIKFGRQLDSVITYTLNNEEITLGNEDINSINPHYNGDILKSVMKCLEIDSNVEIPVGTEINYQFGVKVQDEDVEDYRDNYEYINYGNYIVKSIEKQEDTESYKIICYDKMLYAMKDYEDLNITYPITIRNYINTIATHLGLTFKNANDIFANYNREITEELYLPTDGGSLGYTFRDVLDELAEVTASVICINENDDELEIRYPTETNETFDEESLKNINVTFGEQYGPINTIVLTRSAGSDSVYYPSILPQNPIEIKIEDNQIMNGNDRSDYLPDIYNKLNGLAFSINNYSSTGITYLELYDKYNISIGENIYTCLMLNDDISITQGLEESIFTNEPDYAETEYQYASSTDKMINEAYVLVKKNEGKIIEAVSKADEAKSAVNSVITTQTDMERTIDILSTHIDRTNGEVTEVTTTNGFTFNSSGLNIHTDENSFNTQITNERMQHKDGDTVITETSKDGFMTTYLKQKNQHLYGWDGSEYNFIDEEIDVNGEECYATFWNGSD